VIGLQTSIALLKAGYQVLIVGQHFPGDKSIEYTSPWYVAIANLTCFLYAVAASIELCPNTLPAHGSKNTHSDTVHRAGAQWRSHALREDFEQQQWDIETYSHWLDVIEKERHHPEQKLLSGLAVSPSFWLLLFLLYSFFFLLLGILLTLNQLRKSAFYR
jgi:D-amino-acid oxidase